MPVPLIIVPFATSMALVVIVPLSVTLWSVSPSAPLAPVRTVLPFIVTVPLNPASPVTRKFCASTFTSESP